MHSGPCKEDFDWKKDWEDEQRLTRDELRLKEIEEEENRQIQEDLLACIREIERQEEVEEQQRWLEDWDWLEDWREEE
jgi:hypothetical protein